MKRLDVYLHGQLIGHINHLPGDRNLFSFTDEYQARNDHPTLSLSFKGTDGELISTSRYIQTRVPPFFSNLLPEGHMRDYLAAQAGISPVREFHLLAALGEDLPGALQIRDAEHTSSPFIEEEALSEENEEDSILHFSLAGVQLKFSAVWESEGGLTIPAHGIGGSWIVKLPSAVYNKVPENEFAMMELARKVGIQVPETALVPLNTIGGLPTGIRKSDGNAFIIKRFDRDAHHQGIHIEDFAQVFGVFPDKKYRAASYRNIAEVIWLEVGEKGLIEFTRRFIFNALIGNGDMHLKNWSLIYPDQKHPELAPAYDFVSTIPYLPHDQLALNFVDSKSFHSITEEQLKRFAAKSHFPESLVLETAESTVKAFSQAFPSIYEFSLDPAIIDTLSRHLKSLPLYKL